MLTTFAGLSAASACFAPALILITAHSSSIVCGYLNAEGPGWAVPLALAAAWGYFAWALGGPFLEVWLWSRKDAQQIEDAVAVREPLQVLFPPYSLHALSHMAAWMRGILIRQHDPLPRTSSFMCI